jgi:hypothetical protein
MAVRALRRDVGGEWSLDLSHPFYTDLQRVAWRGSAGGRDDHLQLARPGAERGAARRGRSSTSAGGRMWAGSSAWAYRGRLSLFGASVSFEEASTADRFVQLTDTGIVAEDGAQLGFRPSERYPGQRATRLNALWGVRNVRLRAA